VYPGSGLGAWPGANKIAAQKKEKRIKREDEFGQKGVFFCEDL
jgi:hypothetical protein